jgi:Skp family chaperone for outer membrane proteins
MAKLKKDLQAVMRELKALTRKTQGLVKKLDKLEKAQAAGKRKTKTKAKTAKKAPAKKKVAAKKKPVAKKKAAPLTATDRVVNIIKRSRKGVDLPTLMKKTGLADKTVRNILFMSSRRGKIKRAGRGIYVGA